MITKETSSFEIGNLNIFYDIYLPRNPRSTLIQISHGMVEHRGKYEFIATKLAQNGFIVAVSDHRGHGDSISANAYIIDSAHITTDSKSNIASFNHTSSINKDSLDSTYSTHNQISSTAKDFTNNRIKNEIFWGEMGENGFEMVVSDIYKLNCILRERFAPKKIVLIGHSMGSLIARRFLQKYENNLDMLVLCGTPYPQRFVSLGIILLKVLRFFGINRIGADLAYRLSFLAFNSKYYKFDDLDNGKQSGILWVNRDIDELKRTLKDPKCRFIFTINSFINLLCGLRQVFSKYENKVQKPNLPILFISGEDDACGDFGRGVLSALKHINSQGYKNAKMILYAEARHEIFLELNKDEVARDLISWIESNLMESNE